MRHLLPTSSLAPATMNNACGAPVLQEKKFLALREAYLTNLGRIQHQKSRLTASLKVITYATHRAYGSVRTAPPPPPLRPLPPPFLSQHGSLSL